MTSQFDVRYPQFNKSGNVIYYAAVALGNQKLTINGVEKKPPIPGKSSLSRNKN